MINIFRMAAGLKSLDRRYTFLITVIPALLALALLHVYFFRVEYSRLVENIKKEQNAYVNAQVNIIDATLNTKYSDVLVMASHDIFNEISQGEDVEKFSGLKQEFITFSQCKQVYDQTRLLDKYGKELIRINLVNGVPQAVQPELLQDKSKRYYFSETIKLDKGTIYQSPFDLNIEKGVVERPFKAVIRIATPVVGEDGENIGVIVLNYLGRDLLEKLDNFRVSEDMGRNMLLNSKGYWLNDDNPDSEWGFMFDEWKDITFANEFPKVWDYMKSDKKGQVVTDRGIFSFVRYSSLLGIDRKSPVNRGGYHTDAGEWYVVSLVSSQLIDKKMESIFERLVIFFTLMSVAIIVGALYISKQVKMRTMAKLELVSANLELESRNRQTSLLNNLVNYIQSCTSVDESYKMISSTIEKLFPESSGALNLLDSSTGMLHSVLVWGESFKCDRIYDKQKCWALRSGKIHTVHDLEEDPFCQHRCSPSKCPYLCIPVFAYSEVLGIMNLHFSAELFDDTGRDKMALTLKKELATTVAEHIGLAISSLQLREQLKLQAVRDPLTGLYNRRFMQECLDREIFRAERYQSTLFVYMIDVDHFKSFNDTYGHDIGDKVLKKLAELMSGFIRKDDIACRFGGEEFMMILPGAPLEAAAYRAEEFRELVEEKLKFEHHGETVKVTISMGVAGFPRNGTGPASICEAADVALYQAKDNGRNQVSIAPEAQ